MRDALTLTHARLGPMPGPYGEWSDYLDAAALEWSDEDECADILAEMIDKAHRRGAMDTATANALCERYGLPGYPVPSPAP